MTEKKIKKTKKTSLDWLIGGVLTKIGDTFDRLTGRGYKPSSSLATSELIERLKLLLDAEIDNKDGNSKFVPHNIKLKMQWDKFSTDSEDAIRALENQLHIAAIDHINDQRYYTYAPINIEIKPDYFTDGVKLLASFDKFADEEGEVAVNVTVPQLKIEGLTSPKEKIFEKDKEIFITTFNVKDKPKEIKLAFELGERKSIGRTKENDLMIDDISVSKIHAAFVLNSRNQLMLADTGSTNGTFINGERIAYGRAFPINDGDKLRFGTIEVSLKHMPKEEKESAVEEEKELTELPKTEEVKMIKSISESKVSLTDNESQVLKENNKPEKLAVKSDSANEQRVEKLKEYPTELDFSDVEDFSGFKESTGDGI